MIALVMAGVVSMLLTWWMISQKSVPLIMDHPNERSLHHAPVLRCGGVAILLAILMSWIFLFIKFGVPDGFLWVVGGLIVVAGVSLRDDLYFLPIHVRLLAHLAASALVLVGGYALPWGWLGWIISVLGIIWMLNLYNFMDGMDGFASGMTLSGFGFMGLAAWLGGSELYALLSWAVAVSASGFLLFNFPPARIFMGDSGSTSLGLLAAAFMLWGIQLHLFPIWFPLLIFSPFIVDATVTLIRRGLRGEKVWLAHREHYYQRLVQAGWGHRKTTLVEYGLMLLTGASAIWTLVHQEWVFALLASWSIFYIGLMLLADRHINQGDVK